MNTKRLLAFATATVAAIALTAAPAAADPPAYPGSILTLDCGDGPLDITVAGDGRWTPGHDSASTKVFIPVSFGPEYYAVFVDGVLVDSGTSSEVIAKKGTRAGQGTQECTFESVATYLNEKGAALLE